MEERQHDTLEVPGIEAPHAHRMPLLDYEQVKALRERPVRRCPDCGYAAYKSYCRKCDVYCELGHGHLCSSPEAISDREHEDHRHY